MAILAGWRSRASICGEPQRAPVSKVRSTRSGIVRSYDRYSPTFRSGSSRRCTTHQSTYDRTDLFGPHRRVLRCADPPGAARARQGGVDGAVMRRWQSVHRPPLRWHRRGRRIMIDSVKFTVESTLTPFTQHKRWLEVTIADDRWEPPGRPSSKDIVCAEARRRLAAGELPAGLPVDCHAGLVPSAAVASMRVRTHPHQCRCASSSSIFAPSSKNFAPK